MVGVLRHRCGSVRGLVLLAALLFLSVTTWFVWARFDTLNSRLLDPPMYAQVLWNTANGHPYETTLLRNNRLHVAEHLALAVLPLAPLYGLFPETRLLFLLQGIALAGSGMALFWWASRMLAPPMAGLVTVGYFGAPLLGAIALDGFYPVTFVALSGAWAAAAAAAGRNRTSALLALSGLLLEEEAALLCAGVGLYLLVGKSSARRLATALVLTGVLWLGIAEPLAMPNFHEQGTSRDVSRAENYFSLLRSQPLSWTGRVAANRADPELLRALGWLAPLGLPEQCDYGLPGQCSALRWWVYPTAGLALLSPPTLIMAGPTAAALLLADKGGRFRRHQAAPIAAVFWIAAVLGLSKLARFRLLCLSAAATLALCALLLARLDGVLPLGGQYQSEEVRSSRTAQDLARMAAMIPADASVISSLRALPLLSNRQQLYAFPGEQYGSGLWPPTTLPRFVLIELEHDDGAIAYMESLPRRTGAGGAYRESARTRTAVLLTYSER